MNWYCLRTYVTALSMLCISAIVATQALAGNVDYEDLAKRIVNTSANVQPGEVVVVSGGQHTVPLMEAIAIEVQKAGGFVTIFLNTDKLARARWFDVPEKYLEQPAHYFGSWLKEIDVWIGLPDLEDTKFVESDVPEERFAMASKANQSLAAALNDTEVRVLGVGFPSRQDAAINGLDFATYEQLHWAAVNADYGRIAEQGNHLKQLLMGAKSVRITSPSGTDLTVSVGDRPVLVWDGVVTPEDAKSKVFLTRMATLPDGSVSFSPIEASTNGHVVVPQHRIRDNPLTGVRFEFKSGKITDFHAEQGKKQFEEVMAAHEGTKDVISGISIGLNPALRVIEENGAGYRPIDGAGMVMITTGGSMLSGGSNTATGGFDFPITNATVTIDGRTVVEDGKLKL